MAAATHLEDLVNGAEHIEVCSSAHVALVRREAENGDCYPLLVFLLLGQPAAEIICYEPACSVSLIFSDVATVHEMCSIRSQKSISGRSNKNGGGSHIAVCLY